MHTFLETVKNISIFSNVILLVGLSLEKTLTKNDKNANLASNISVFLGMMLSFYLISVSTLLINTIIYKYYLQSLLLTFLLITPFLIGSLSTYKKANLFINIQIFTLLTSLIILMMSH